MTKSSVTGTELVTTKTYRQAIRPEQVSYLIIFSGVIQPAEP